MSRLPAVCENSDMLHPSPEMHQWNKRLENTATGPGVYLMMDPEGAVLYVGKARNLRRRLSNYFGSGLRLDAKGRALVGRIAAFETIVTANEKEALILEANLIKRHKPRYNVVLKDDKRYPALRLNVDNPFPYLSIVRKIKDDGALYFGPFASAQAVRQTLKFIDKTFKLRKCRTRELRPRARPCLNYQMGRCPGLCALGGDAAAYRRTVAEVILFLKGRTPQLIRDLRRQMLAAAAEQAFEKAAAFRDKMQALEKTLERQSIVSADFVDRDVVAIAAAEELTVITLLAVRGGAVVSSQNYNFGRTLSTEDEVLEAFIRQYYRNAPFMPKEILVSQTVANRRLLEDLLSVMRGRKVSIRLPRRGEKARLIAMAVRNAENARHDSMADTRQRRRLLEGLQRRLKLGKFPGRIECFDNSNLSGTQPVASMVVFEDGVARHALYRRYKLKTEAARDDYAGMAEVLRRRFGKSREDEPHPDLLIVDGGRGQLNIALSVLKDLGLETTFAVVGLAKKDVGRGEKEDKLYQAGRANPVNFGQDREQLLFLQRIRDEAHRFAIAFQRQRRRGQALHSILDDIPGVGPKRKATLIKHFGGLQKIREADTEALARLPGLNRSLAETLKRHLSGRPQNVPLEVENEARRTENSELPSDA